MTQSHPVVAVVLAGGRGRRFGSDKLVTEVDGVAMLLRVIDAARGAVSEVYISVGSSNSASSRSYALIEATGLEVIRDEIPAVGPIGGLYTAFRRLHAEWVLLVAGDMPFLTSKCLLELVAETSSDVDAVVAREPDGRLHPVAACYRSSVLPNIESCLQHGDFTMRTLISSLNNVRYVTFRVDTLRNVNRPDDLQDPRALSVE